MLYHIFQSLNEWHIPGARLFNYVSFRFAFAFIASLLISTIWGKNIIMRLQKLQIGEVVRDLGLEGQLSKKGTPTMGGIIIVLAILIPVIFICDLTNIYIILMIITTLIMATLGFVDDYIKVFKKNKNGLPGKYKIFGQVLLGLIVGISLYMSPQVVVNKNIEHQHENNTIIKISKEQTKEPVTTIPFVKGHELNYSKVIPFLDGNTKILLGWAIFISMTVFVVTMLSNTVNLTDGIDGLASGNSAIVGVALGIFAYVSSHTNIASYLNIMFIPGAHELVIFSGALIGATIGFLWYNSYPAQVFMGDTGSLTLGGIIGVFAIAVRKELLLPILCGVFIVEGISVLLQVGYFKFTKKKKGAGVRIFKMTPLHHHFQVPTTKDTMSIIKMPKGALPESKITIRFFLICIILAVLSIITLKIR